MKHFSLSVLMGRVTGVFAAGGLLLMTGCAGFGGGSFPDAPVSGGVGQIGSISGSNYGGHAPLVGAHIYLVQPSTSSYGGVVSNLLTTNGTYASTYPLVANGSWPTATSGGNASDQFVPSGFNGVTTDTTGQFNISGDYTCTAGVPVILIGYGGYPSFVPATTGGTNTFAVTNASTYNDGSAGVYLTYTVTTTSNTPQLFYVGETVTVSGATGGAAGFNQTGVVLGSAPVQTSNPGSPTTQSLSTTQFSIYVLYNSTLTSATPSGLNSGNLGQSATAAPSFNPAATNMAVLGNCPSTGTFASGASQIRYIYMNEVSTAAAAYAFAGFTNTAQNGQSGYDEFHIGAPASNLVGLQNAAITAGNLYNIQGGNTATNNPDGDVHIARTTTPSGTGTVPQTQIDTIGNILAACVDSQNTYRLGLGTQSPQCKTLFQYAQDNGVYDTTASTHQAFNIAQAAFSLARFPQGNGTGTTACACYGGAQTITSVPTSGTASTFTNGVYNVVSGNVPFTPQLSSAPSDYAIAIQWSDASANGGTVTNGVASGGTAIATTDLAIDAQGNVWTPSTTYNLTGGVFEFSPLTGLYTAYTAPLSQDNPGIAIDTSGNAWVPGLTGAYKFTPGTAAGALVSAVGGGSESIALDGSNVYLMQNGNTGLERLVKESQAGVAAGGNFPVVAVGGNTVNTAAGCLYFGQYLTVDTAGNIWTASADQNDYTPDNSICEFTSAGVLQYSYNFAGKYNQTLPHSIEVDAGNNAWVADKNNNLLEKFPAGMTTAQNGTGAVITSGSPLNLPKGIAVDGANSIWVTNQGGGIVHYTDSNVALSGTKYTGGGTTTDLIYGGVDPSGNVWASATNEGQLVQFVGAATPTVTPIAYAKANSAVGGKPGLGVAKIIQYNVSNSGILQFECVSTCPISGTETFTVSGFPTSTFLNGQTFTMTVTPGFPNYMQTTAATTYSYTAAVNEKGIASAMN